MNPLFPIEVFVHIVDAIFRDIILEIINNFRTISIDLYKIYNSTLPYIRLRENRVMYISKQFYNISIESNLYLDLQTYELAGFCVRIDHLCLLSGDIRDYLTVEFTMHFAAYLINAKKDVELRKLNSLLGLRDKVMFAKELITKYKFIFFYHWPSAAEFMC